MFCLSRKGILSDGLDIVSRLCSNDCIMLSCLVFAGRSFYSPRNLCRFRRLHVVAAGLTALLLPVLGGSGVPASSASGTVETPSVELTLVYKSADDVSIQWAQFLPSGNVLAATDKHELLEWMLDSRDWVRTRDMKIFKSEHSFAAVSPDGQRLATADSTATRLWNRVTGDIVASLELRFTGTPLAFSPDGRYLAVSSSDGQTCLLVNAQTGESIRTLSADRKGQVTALTFSHDAALLACGFITGSVTVWDLAPGAPRAAWFKHGWLYDLAFSPDDRKLAVGAGLSVRLWNLSGSEPTDGADKSAADKQADRQTPLLNRMRMFNPAQAPGILGSPRDAGLQSVRAVDFSPDGSWLVEGIGGNNMSLGTPMKGRIEIWDLDRNAQTYAQAVDGHVLDVAVSPDGQYLLSVHLVPSAAGGTKPRRELCVWRSPVQTSAKPAPAAAADTVRASKNIILGGDKQLTVPKSAPSTGPADLELAWKLYSDGKWDDARRRCQQIVAANGRSADGYDLLGYIDRARSDFEAANNAIQHAIEIRTAQFGPKDPTVAFSLNNLAMLRHVQKRWDEAEILYGEAREIWEGRRGEYSEELAACLKNLGLLFVDRGRFTEADHALIGSLGFARRMKNPSAVSEAEILETLADLYVKMNRTPEAEIYRTQAKILRAKSTGKN